MDILVISFHMTLIKKKALTWMKSQNALLRIVKLDAVDHFTQKLIVTCVDLTCLNFIKGPNWKVYLRYERLRWCCTGSTCFCWPSIYIHYTAAHPKCSLSVERSEPKLQPLISVLRTRHVPNILSPCVPAENVNLSKEREKIVRTDWKVKRGNEWEGERGLLLLGGNDTSNRDS